MVPERKAESIREGPGMPPHELAAEGSRRPTGFLGERQEKVDAETAVVFLQLMLDVQGSECFQWLEGRKYFATAQTLSCDAFRTVNRQDVRRKHFRM